MTTSLKKPLVSASAAVSLFLLIPMTAGSSAGTHSARKLQPYMGGGRFQRGSWAVRGAANLKQSPPPKAQIGSARHQAIVHLSRARLGLCFRPNRDRRSGQKTFGCAVQNSKSGVAAMRIEHAFDGRHPFSAIMARPSRRFAVLSPLPLFSLLLFPCSGRIFFPDIFPVSILAILPQVFEKAGLCRKIKSQQRAIFPVSRENSA